jgi:hypothetical protein
VAVRQQKEMSVEFVHPLASHPVLERSGNVTLAELGGPPSSNIHWRLRPESDEKSQAQECAGAHPIEDIINIDEPPLVCNVPRATNGLTQRQKYVASVARDAFVTTGRVPKHVVLPKSNIAARD